MANKCVANNRKVKALKGEKLNSGSDANRTKFNLKLDNGKSALASCRLAFERPSFETQLDG